MCAKVPFTSGRCFEVSETSDGKVRRGWAFSWPSAFAVSVGIVLSLWLLLGLLPHLMTLTLDAIGSASWLRDVLVTGFFAFAFGGIAYALRFLQKRGRI